ncbi:MAG TPA: hypothetical protein VLF43_03620, partial [Candidatus Saccharimonadales bacterium]|nr:hypothetical protein [Candidatus Saccharimonadales bacterium]
AAIQKQAITKQADLHVLTNVPKAANLPFLPLFQQRNFGLALQAMQYVAERDGLDLSASRIRQAAQTSILGRMEEYYSHDKTIILDVAHNPQKFGSLLASVRAKYATQDIAVLVRLPSGSRTSKRSQAIVQLLQRNVQYVHIVDSADDPLQAFNEVMQRAEPVVIVASFYLLNYIRPVVRAAYGADLKPVTRV